MRRKICTIIVGLILFCINITSAQDDEPRNSIWYSNYIYVKLNKKFYLDNFLVSAFDLDKKHRFGFIQTDLALNYRLNKKIRFLGAYSNSQFRYFNSYKRRFGKDPNLFDALTIHRFGVGIQYRLKFLTSFRFNQKLVAQYYTPQPEKYQFRYVYSGKLSYRHKNAPLHLSPYFQYFLYYYSGGKEFEYEDMDTGEIVNQASNGLHRYRIRAGVSFKPIPKYRPLSLVFYYAIQREFNIEGFGNDLNITVPGRKRPLLPFNNSNIIGMQVNLIYN